jgi:hypothetical protein
MTQDQDDAQWLGQLRDTCGDNAGDFFALARGIASGLDGYVVSG